MQFGNIVEKAEDAPKNDLEAKLYRVFTKARDAACDEFPEAYTEVLVDGECFRLCTRECERIGLVSPLARVIFVYKPEMLPRVEQLAAQYRARLRKEFKIVKEYEE